MEKKYKKKLLCIQNCIFLHHKQKHNTMNRLSINPEFISDNNTFKFVEVPTMYKGFYDVMYKGERIAIINGLSAPLQWVAKKGTIIPIKVQEQLEKMVVRLCVKSAIKNGLVKLA